MYDYRTSRAVQEERYLQHASEGMKRQHSRARWQTMLTKVAQRLRKVLRRPDVGAEPVIHN